jgi:hypothetical protein
LKESVRCESMQNRIVFLKSQIPNKDQSKCELLESLEPFNILQSNLREGPSLRDCRSSDETAESMTVTSEASMGLIYKSMSK